MTGASRTGMGWTARLLIALTLILLGAAAATWGLARYDSAARVLGVVPRDVQAEPAIEGPQQQRLANTAPATAPAEIQSEVADLEARLERVENAASQAQGSVGRADGLLVTFAARRAIDRGVGLGYLEPLLVERFGVRHPQAVATIVTASRNPIRLSDLTRQYQELEPALLAAGPGEGIFAGLKRELGSLVHVHRGDRPSTQPQARYERAMSSLRAGEVDAALAETMRLPGATRANSWIANARQYVAVRRALDEVEAAALLGNSAQG